MARYRPIRKYGNSMVISLTLADVRDLNLKVGDLIDIEDAVRKTSISKDTAKLLKVKRK